MLYLIIIDEYNNIIAKIPAIKDSGKNINFTEQREMIKLYRELYKGQNVQFKFGNIVTEEQFQETVKLLSEIYEKYPDMGHFYVKEDEDFTRVGYHINK